MAQIKKSTAPINAHFQNNIPLCIKYFEAQKSCLWSPASKYKSQGMIFKITSEILTYLLVVKAIKV